MIRDKDFAHRLRLYLFGVGLGLVLVLVILSVRDQSVFGWTPQNRLKDQLAQAPMGYSPQAVCLIQCLDLSVGVDVLRKHGNIDLSESKTRQDPRLYRVTYSKEGIELESDWAFYTDSIALVNLWAPGAEACNCD